MDNGRDKEDSVGVVPIAAISNTAKVRVRDLTASANDTSDASFQIGLSRIIINNPSASNRFLVGDTTTIAWEWEGAQMDNERIEYKIGASETTWQIVPGAMSVAGTTYVWSGIPDSVSNDVYLRVSGNTVSNTGNYNWTVPNDTSGTVKIKVADFYDEATVLDLLYVNDNSGWIQGGVVSGATHQYPYDSFRTIWSRNMYVDEEVNWTADSTKAIEVKISAEAAKTNRLGELGGLVGDLLSKIAEIEARQNNLNGEARLVI